MQGRVARWQLQADFVASQLAGQRRSASQSSFDMVLPLAASDCSMMPPSMSSLRFCISMIRSSTVPALQDYSEVNVTPLSATKARGVCAASPGTGLQCLQQRIEESEQLHQLLFYSICNRGCRRVSANSANQRRSSGIGSQRC